MSDTIPMTHARRIHYIDERIQKGLLLGLVVLELLITAISFVFLYHGFDGLIERSLYTVHFSGAGSYQEMLRMVGWVVVITIAIEFVVLILADRVWARYLDQILGWFRDRVGKAGRLDFSDANADNDRLHQLADLTTRWYATERERLVRLRRRVDGLERALEQGGEAELRGALRELRDALP